MEVLPVSYMPGDPMLIDKIVYELKSQGIFDSFRKECISDVDTKPAYQNLRQRVESSVSGFLRKQKWNPDMNKNHVREMLRKHIHESGYLETGVERIVDQVVNPKMNTVFLPKVTEVVYKYLGIERPNTIIDKPMRNLNLSVENLLPQDLEAVSPESGTADKTDDKFDGLDDSKMDEDESPPFEPIEEQILHEENSVDSHLSGFSGLVSHDSNHSDGQRPLQIDMDTQMSKPSSDGRSSILIDDSTTKMDMGEDSRNDSNSKGFEENSNSAKFDVSREKKDHKRDDKDRKDRERHKSDRHRSKSDNHDRKDDRKSDRDKKDKYSSSRDKERDKNKDRKDSSSSKSRSDREKSDKDKDKYKSSSSRHSSGGRDKSSSRKDGSKDKDRGDHRDKDKNRDNKDKPSSRDKPRDDKNRSSSSSKSDSKNRKSSSSTSSRRDKDKKDSRKQEKDDHFSSKHRPERRSTDRDSNDGSGLKSSSSSYCESNSSSQNSTTQNKNQEVSNSNSNDSGNSDAVEGKQPVLLDAKDLNNSGEILLGNHQQRLKLIIPKIASNIHEARKLMKIRKQLKKIEKQRDEEINKAEKKQNEIVETEKIVDNTTEVEPEGVTPPVSLSVSMATWDALEAKLNETINYDTYYDPDDGEVNLEPTTSKIQDEVNPKPKIQEELNLEPLVNSEIQAEGELNPKAVEVFEINTEEEIDEKPIIVSNESTIQENILIPQEIRNDITNDVVVENIEVEKSVEEDFLYFLPESPKKEEICIKYLSDCMNKLQKDIEDVQARIALSLCNNIPTTDPNELNKENKRAGLKRKVVERSNAISKIRNNNNVIQVTAHDEKFSLPLSPAESDTSLDKRIETEVQQAEAKPKRRINVKKRYSSEDLYKPRPVINRRSTRRRGAEVD